MTSSPTEPFGWAILGPGNIARRFASQLPDSTGRLVAVGSSDPERAAAFGPANGAPEASAGTYEQVLADPAVQGVYLSTVHTTHAALAIQAIEAGKAVLCEKPMSVNHAQAQAMVDAARTHGVALVEAYMYRFHPQTTKLPELITSGAIGQVRHIDASFAFGGAGSNQTGRLFQTETAGGGILDVGGYPVSMARAVAGAAIGRPFADPTSLTASGTIGSTGVDEWAVANLTFPGGITANVRTGVRLTDENAVTVYGAQGKIQLSDPWTLTAHPEIVLTVVGQEPQTLALEGRSYAHEADALARAVADGTGEAPQMSLDDSLGNALVLDQWREAIGLRYPFEAEDANIGTVSGRPLTVDADAPMIYGEIAGVGKPVSRLVMGVDNQLNLSHASAVFDHFFSRGGNTFDTGYIYGGGLMEGRLGKWIENRGIRDQVVVITKGAHTPHCDPESITRQLLESLERQHTDYADIYMMHRDNLAFPVGEFVDVMDEHVNAGRIRVFGGSNWTPARVDEANAYAAANGKHGFSVLSNHFGLAEALDVPWAGCEHVTDAASKQWLVERQIPLLPWSSQARGFFAGRASADDRADAELVRCYYSDANFERLRRAEQLGQELGVPTTAIALAFVLNQPFPTFPLFGPRTIAECRSSMRGLGVELSPQQLAWLDLAD